MRAKIKYAMSAGHAEIFGFRHANAAILRCDIGRSLAVLGIALLMVSVLSAGQGWAAGQSDEGNIQNLDSRWIPWIGSWRLISNVDKTGYVLEISNNILEIKPGDDGKSVLMKGVQGEEVLYDEKKIIVDGSRHPLEDDDCDGWYKYSWSDTGMRLLFESEAVCADNRLRTISGISAFTDPSEWVDIQLLTSGEERMMTIRRYRQGDESKDSSVERSRRHFARVAAGANFSADEIIELTGKVAPEVLEAVLMEIRKPFEINSKVLLRLSKGGVSPQVTDLMVALSFPDKFTVERHDVKPVEKPESGDFSAPIVYPYAWSPFGMWSYYDPFFSWYWSSPSYLYGYWGWGWGGYYSPIYWGSSGWASYGSSSGYSISGGRLVAGRGYSTVTAGGSSGRARYAQPRGSYRTVSRAGRYGVSAGTYGGGGYSGGGSSGGSGGGSSGGYSGGSSGGYSGGGSASPGGYSGGGRGGGGTAHGR